MKKQKFAVILSATAFSAVLATGCASYSSPYSSSVEPAPKWPSGFTAYVDNPTEFGGAHAECTLESIERARASGFVSHGGIHIAFVSCMSRHGWKWTGN